MCIHFMYIKAQLRKMLSVKVWKRAITCRDISSVAICCHVHIDATLCNTCILYCLHALWTEVVLFQILPQHVSRLEFCFLIRICILWQVCFLVGNLFICRNIYNCNNWQSHVFVIHHTRSMWCHIMNDYSSLGHIYIAIIM